MLNKNNVFIYIPNVINYVRIVCVLFMIYFIRTKPRVSFCLCVFSGILDSFDGPVARYFDQTSKFGYLLDMSMDRLTNSVQYFVLASFYAKYSIYFYAVLSVEMLKDFSNLLISNQKFYLQILNLDSSQIKEKLNSAHSVNSSEIITNDKFDLNQFILVQFYHYVWYSSDLFYWLLYFNYFTREYNEDYLPQVDLNNNVLVIKSKPGLFDSLNQFLEIKYTQFFVSKRNNCRFSFNFKTILQIIEYFCFLGAFLKFYLNFKTFIFYLSEIVQLDNQIIDRDYFNKNSF